MLPERGIKICTSGPFTATKLTPLSVAQARARMVLLHPGGPYKSRPFGGRTPSRWKASGCNNGHSTASRSFCMMSACPPISSNRMGGVSMNRERIADGRTVGSASERSDGVNFRVIIVAAGSALNAGGVYVIHRLMARVPASRTTALRSAPTYP